MNGSLWARVGTGREVHRHNPEKSDCLAKTQFYAKSEDDACEMTPAQCPNSKTHVCMHVVELRVNGGGNLDLHNVARCLGQ